MEAQTCPWLALGASLVTEEYREIPSTPHPPTPHTQSLWRCPFSPLSALFPAVHTKPSTSVFFFLFFTPPAFSLLHLEHHTWTHTPCLSLSPLSILWWCVHQIKQFWGGWIGPWKEWVGRGLEGCAVFAVMAHPPGQRRLLLCTL